MPVSAFLSVTVLLPNPGCCAGPGGDDDSFFNRAEEDTCLCSLTVVRRALLITGRCAQGEVEVTVLFAPAREDAYAAMAWCQMEGREARLPLVLQGEGLGPQVGQPI